MSPLPTINWGGPGYASYEVEMKASGKEKDAQNLQASESQMLMGWAGKQFGEQQGWLNNIIMPQLQKMFTNPEGFGLKALSDMRSQAISTIGGQLEAQQKQLAANFATENMAGLGSGVQMALGAGLTQQAVGQEATALQNIDIANAQAKMQEQQWAGGALMQGVQQLGQIPGSVEQLTKSTGQQFNEAYTMAQQGGFWSNLASSVLTSAATAFGGPLGGMAANALTGALGIGRPTAGQVSAASDLGASQAASYPSLTAGISGPSGP